MSPASLSHSTIPKARGISDPGSVLRSDRYATRQTILEARSPKIAIIIFLRTSLQVTVVSLSLTPQNLTGFFSPFPYSSAIFFDPFVLSGQLVRFLALT